MMPCICWDKGNKVKQEVVLIVIQIQELKKHDKDEQNKGVESFTPNGMLRDYLIMPRYGNSGKNHQRGSQGIHIYIRY